MVLACPEHQQIGGLAMWIGGSVYYFLAFMVIFFLWAQPEERDGRHLYVVRDPSG